MMRAALCAWIETKKRNIKHSKQDQIFFQNPPKKEKTMTCDEMSPSRSGGCQYLTDIHQHRVAGKLRRSQSCRKSKWNQMTIVRFLHPYNPFVVNRENEDPDAFAPWGKLKGC
jgi:hypothetical protein